MITNDLNCMFVVSFAAFRAYAPFVEMDWPLYHMDDDADIDTSS